MGRKMCSMPFKWLSKSVGKKKKSHKNEGNREGFLLIERLCILDEVAMVSKRKFD